MAAELRRGSIRDAAARASLRSTVARRLPGARRRPARDQPCAARPDRPLIALPSDRVVCWCPIPANLVGRPGRRSDHVVGNAGRKRSAQISPSLAVPVDHRASPRWGPPARLPPGVGILWVPGSQALRPRSRSPGGGGMPLCRLLALAMPPVRGFLGRACRRAPRRRAAGRPGGRPGHGARPARPGRALRLGGDPTGRHRDRGDRARRGPRATRAHPGRLERRCSSTPVRRRSHRRAAAPAGVAASTCLSHARPGRSRRRRGRGARRDARIAGARRRTACAAPRATASSVSRSVAACGRSRRTPASSCAPGAWSSTSFSPRREGGSLHAGRTPPTAISRRSLRAAAACPSC